MARTVPVLNASEYLERFLGLVVVLCESGVLEDDGCDMESEEDDDRDEEEGEFCLRLRPRDDSLHLLWDVDVDGSDKVGLRALVRAALTAVSSAACCAAVNG